MTNQPKRVTITLPELFAAQTHRATMRQFHAIRFHAMYIAKHLNPAWYDLPESIKIFLNFTISYYTQGIVLNGTKDTKCHNYCDHATIINTDKYSIVRMFISSLEFHLLCNSFFMEFK